MRRDYDFPAKGINRHVSNYIRSLPDLAGKIVVDIPCGDGRASYEFWKMGATVKPFDLYPSFMKIREMRAQYADLAEQLPLDDNSVDYIICQEGIEHVSDQLKVFSEFNRILRKNGKLLITTPNFSHVRARLSQFFLESDLWQRMPPTEIDSVWFADQDSDRLYFGHLFLIGVQRLKTLAVLAGFEVKECVRADIGTTSLVLGILLYPFFLFMTFLSYTIYQRKNTHVQKMVRKAILWDRLKLNLSPKTLFQKHTFWVLQKEQDLAEVVTRLRAMSKEK